MICMTAPENPAMFIDFMDFRDLVDWVNPLIHIKKKSEK